MDRTASLSSVEKIGEAMRRSLPHLPAEARAVVASMLDPRLLPIIGAAIIAWAVSHLVGVGEFVDVVMLSVGAIALGFSVFEGSREMLDFARGAVNARVDRDLDRAAEYFARAITILGISTVQAVLLRGGIRAVRPRGMPHLRPMQRVGSPPAAGNRLRLTRLSTLDGKAGTTDAYGTLQVARDQSLSEQRVTLFHELVHRYFAPRTGPFRQLRASLHMTGYVRSALLRYVEEALAEGYGQLRVHGLAAAVRQWRFPVANGYMTVSEIAAEGQAIGIISLSGVSFQVYISLGQMPRQP